jgi:hypothetical protein
MVIWIPASLLLWALIIFGVKSAVADHYMCGNYQPAVPLTVSVDPNLEGSGVTSADVVAAFDRWNEAAGRDIFIVHRGRWRDADVLLTNNGFRTTWVNTPCSNLNFNQRGNNRAVIFMGNDNAKTNLYWLTHELGHALGLADHTFGHVIVPAHINPAVCAPWGHPLYSAYRGVMSYCTSAQNWLTVLSDDIEMLWRILSR